MKIFISYSHQDYKFINSIINELSNDKYEVLSINSNSILPGDSIIKNIYNLIDQSDVVLFILSNNKYNNWMQFELSYVLSKNKRFIPILLNNNIDLPFFIKDIIYIDFSNKHKFSNNVNLLKNAINNANTINYDLKHIIENTEHTIANQLKLNKLELTLYQKEIRNKNTSLINILMNIILLLATIAFLIILSLLIFNKTNGNPYIIAITSSVVSCVFGIFMTLIISKYKRGASK